MTCENPSPLIGKPSDASRRTASYWERGLVSKPKNTPVLVKNDLLCFIFSWTLFLTELKS